MVLYSLNKDGWFLSFQGKGKVEIIGYCSCWWWGFRLPVQDREHFLSWGIEYHPYTHTQCCCISFGKATVSSREIIQAHTCTSGWAEASWLSSLCLRAQHCSGGVSGGCQHAPVCRKLVVSAVLSAASCPSNTRGKLNIMTCWTGGQLLVRRLCFCCLSCCYKFLTLAFHFWYFSLGQIKDGFVTSGSLRTRQLQAMKYAPAFRGRTGDPLLGIRGGKGLREQEWGFCLRFSPCACARTTNLPSCVLGE